MNRRPTNYGDAPPGYGDQETASFLSDVESPTNSRLNGGTMRLLPTSGDGADDMDPHPRAPSPSHYSYDPVYDHTPYVYTRPRKCHPIRLHIPVVPLRDGPHSPSTLSHCLT